MNSTQIREYLKNGELKTPAYVFDMDVLAEHVKKMQEIVGNDIGLCYAMKANPFLVPAMAQLVDKIEVCSPGELSICQEYGIPGHKIIFSGVNKACQDVETALSYGVAVITVESEKHFRLICDYCKRHNTTADVLFRITNGSQFGMNVEDIEAILSHREQYAYIHVKGIHYFSGTQKKKPDKWKEELDELDSYIERIRDVYGLDELTLEYGAGLPVPYFEGEDFDNLYQPLETMLTLMREKPCDYHVVLELGRFFAFSCGTYFTRVEEVKNNKGTHYVLVDGGIHQLNYYGQNMAMRIPQMELFDMDEELHSELSTKCNVEEVIEDGDYTICGSLCTMADVLVRRWKGTMPKENDVYAFYNAGSYSVTEAPALFLSRKMPIIYAYSQVDGLKVLRESREAYEINLVDGVCR